MNREGHPVARCTVERLMRDLGLRGISREKTRKTRRLNTSMMNAA
jgi:putative transposase